MAIAAWRSSVALAPGALGVFGSNTASRSRHNALENHAKRTSWLLTPLPQQAEYPNHVWTYDILFDRLADGRPFKTLSVLDEFTRECLGILVAISIHAEDVIAFLAGILQQRNAPVFLRSDNGSEFTAAAVQTWLADKKVGPAFIPPGQPWKNGFIESFHDKFRDECLQREWFSSLLDAQVVIADWRLHYNAQRPHSSLGYKTPAAFAAQYITQIQPALTLISAGHKN
jgi:putative transposase